MKSPAKNPCGSCPYRRDTPPGVWHPEEYAKLPEFDKPTGDQPPAVFLCHQQNQRICGGWAATHDMTESLGLRLACSLGAIDDAEYDKTVDYSTTIPLYGSGQEAHDAGMSGVPTPSDKAKKTIDKLANKLGDKVRR